MAKADWQENVPCQWPERSPVRSSSEWWARENGEGEEEKGFFSPLLCGKRRKGLAKAAKRKKKGKRDG